MPSNPLCLDNKTTSENWLQTKKTMASSVLEHAIKVRKPYTITKQRERWTDEEHGKFLEALKLYGRAWRQIEEHIGTKTAVQIRSHAQKFFTKVVLESNGDNSDESKTLSIPPPRPKRKPLHPYPRKLGNSPSIPAVEKGAWSLIPKLSVVSESKLLSNEQENRSPTSVLSVVGSDTFHSSSASGIMSSNASPASSEQVETSLGEQDDVGHSTTTSVEDDDKSLKTTDMELDMGTDDSIPDNEASPAESPATSLKLFGKTVIVADTQKPLCSTVDDAEQPYEAPTSTNQWNAAPMFYILPSSGVSMSASVSMPYLWGFCGDAASDVAAAKRLKSGERETETSFAGSNTVPRGESSVEDGSGPPNVSLKFRPSETSAFRSLKATKNKPCQGFVPYRRCVPDKEVENQKTGGENREGRGLHLCL
ncbi:uncharacterized protein A4U43_C07F23480 [Asparagus officinalis]|uniref:Uncharacterized protein n=1 Tax=Asparagus officinalis TaxID=4686 RepID=A0A5P1EJJ3_ASPOF|nr:protein REVEILLE 2-like [Asparagus officinalis]ONK64230.1 uncharacterized protein A4U43_C07F23480 [Asparagus officinalis]